VFHTRRTVGLAVVMVAAMVLMPTACVTGTGTSAGGDPNRLTQEQIAAANVSTLYDVVQRLRPRWIEVRSQRTFELETEVLVVLNRTVLGGVDELRNLGVEIAAEMEYMTGSQAHGEFSLPGNRHVEGVVIVRTR